MVFPTHRIRRIGPYVGTAGLIFSSSYVLAIYADSKMKPNISKIDNYYVFMNKRMIQNPDSNNPIDILRKFWDKSRESQKTIYSIIIANSIIFLAWRIPSFSLVLSRYFLHSINSHPLSMMGSIFSHKSLMHLCFNMLALNSFGSFLHEKMGREQFLAFYLSSGMSSSLISHIYKSLRWNFTPSLGASGAIFGVVGGCAHYPDLKVSLILLPIHSIPINQALPAMMGIDALGMFFDWKIFDHAAHLGGALFGYFFYPISQDKIWKNRHRILKILKS